MCKFRAIFGSNFNCSGKLYQKITKYGDLLVARRRVVQNFVWANELSIQFHQFDWTLRIFHGKNLVRIFATSAVNGIILDATWFSGSFIPTFLFSLPAETKLFLCTINARSLSNFCRILSGASLLWIWIDWCVTSMFPFSWIFWFILQWCQKVKQLSIDFVSVLSS